MAANRFLDHLAERAFAAATVRAYAYGVLCFTRFCDARRLRLADDVPVDLFEWVGWQTTGARPRSGTVMAMVRHAGAAPASVNRDEVGVFLADLLTHRDRAIVMLMLLGGLRAGEVRRLRLADVHVAMRRVRCEAFNGRVSGQVFRRANPYKGSGQR